MQEEDDNNKLNINTLAMMNLTEGLVENNNTVSSAIAILSENLEETSESIKRTEEKLNIILKNIEVLNETGIFSFLKYVKRVFTAFIIALGVGVLMFVFKMGINLYILIQKSTNLPIK